MKLSSHVQFNEYLLPFPQHQPSLGSKGTISSLFPVWSKGGKVGRDVICLWVTSLPFFEFCIVPQGLLGPWGKVEIAFFFKTLMNWFLAALGLHCCVWAFSSCGEWGLLISCGTQAFHCCGLSCFRVRALGRKGSVVVAHRLSCCVACGFFLDQGSNPCPLCWQADS